MDIVRWDSIPPNICGIVSREESLSLLLLFFLMSMNKANNNNAKKEEEEEELIVIVQWIRYSQLNYKVTL
jgi:hypothetical protein